MVYEIEVMMDDRGRFVRALRALNEAGKVAIVDSGETATTVWAEVKTQLGTPALREALQAEDYHDAIAIRAHGDAGRQ